jgi:hypothetical protein
MPPSCTKYSYETMSSNHCSRVCNGLCQNFTGPHFTTKALISYALEFNKLNFDKLNHKLVWCDEYDLLFSSSTINKSKCVSKSIKLVHKYTFYQTLEILNSLHLELSSICSIEH